MIYYHISGVFIKTNPSYCFVNEVWQVVVYFGYVLDLSSAELTWMQFIFIFQKKMVSKLRKLDQQLYFIA